MAMRFYSSKGSILASCVLAGATTAQAIMADKGPNSYQTIPDRNAFDLKPAPRVEVPKAAESVFQKIILTGITTILGNKRALMKVLPPTRQGEQVKELSLILTEGQREGDVEVLQIDENAGAVKVVNCGRQMTLTFEKDGAKLPSPPAPGTPATATIPAPTGVLAPGSNPVAAAAQPYHVPTRTFNLPTYHPATSNVTAVPMPSVPSPTVQPSNPNPNNLSPALTPEQQAALALLEREASKTASTPAPAVPVPPPGPIIPGGSTPITEPGQANLSGRIPSTIVPQ